MDCKKWEAFLQGSPHTERGGRERAALGTAVKEGYRAGLARAEAHKPPQMPWGSGGYPCRHLSNPRMPTAVARQSGALHAQAKCLTFHRLIYQEHSPRKTQTG